MSHMYFAICPQVDKRRKRKVMLYWLKFDDNMDFPSFSEKYLERQWEQKLITHLTP